MVVTSYPIREINAYELHTPNSVRKIEVFSKVGHLDCDVDDKLIAEMGDHHKLLFEEIVYEGIGHVMVSVNGQNVQPQEIRFRIEGVTSLGDAFEKYEDFAAKAVAEMQKEHEKMQQQKQNQILTPGDLL